MSEINIDSLIRELAPELKKNRIKKSTSLKLEGLLMVLLKLPISELKQSHTFELLLTLQDKKLSNKAKFLITQLSLKIALNNSETDESWEKIREIFNGEPSIRTKDGTNYNIDELKAKGIKEIKTTIYTPNNNLVVKETNYIYHNDGKVDTEVIYDIQNRSPKNLPNLFTDYARKFLNDLDNEEHEMKVLP